MAPSTRLGDETGSFFSTGIGIGPAEGSECEYARVDKPTTRNVFTPFADLQPLTGYLSYNYFLLYRT